MVLNQLTLNIMQRISVEQVVFRPPLQLVHRAWRAWPYAARITSEGVLTGLKAILWASGRYYHLQASCDRISQDLQYISARCVRTSNMGMITKVYCTFCVKASHECDVQAQYVKRRCLAHIPLTEALCPWGNSNRARFWEDFLLVSQLMMWKVSSAMHVMKFLLYFMMWPSGQLHHVDRSVCFVNVLGHT